MKKVLKYILIAIIVIAAVALIDFFIGDEYISKFEAFSYAVVAALTGYAYAESQYNKNGELERLEKSLEVKQGTILELSEECRSERIKYKELEYIIEVMSVLKCTKETAEKHLTCMREHDLLSEFIYAETINEKKDIIRTAAYRSNQDKNA